VPVARKTSYILSELKEHAPFTVFGSLLGVIFMWLFRGLDAGASYTLFYIFHPGHVLLSSVTTTALFRRYSKRSSFIVIFLVGYIGSVGVATVSDSVIPYVGEILLGLHVSPHEHSAPKTQEGEAQTSERTIHDQPVNNHSDSDHGFGIHIGFIEEWYIVNPAALVGIVIGFFLMRTKFTHGGHVLLSIWASLFHIMMALGQNINFAQWVGIFVFLFLAVWLPCCFSDIVFPLLFVKSKDELPTCHCR